MNRLMVPFLALSAIAAIDVLTGVTATPAQACVIANFKNAANSCPSGTTYGRGASAPPEVVAVPAAAPPGAVGCVKTNVKGFNNACRN